MRQKLYLIFMGACFLVAAQQKGKQSLAQLRESPAGSKIIWFLDAVESGNLTGESISKYFAPKLIDKIGSDKLVTAFEDIKMNDGSLVLYQADRKKMTEYELIVKGTKSNEWMKMGFYFEDENPYRIAGFTIDTTDGSFESLKIIYPKPN